MPICPVSLVVSRSGSLATIKALWALTRRLFRQSDMRRSVVAALVLAALTASCRGGQCEVNCGPPGVYVGVLALPRAWVASDDITLCADTSCTTRIAPDVITTPLDRDTAPRVISLTVRDHRAVVFRAETRHRYSLSTGGQCNCGGSISLTVDRTGHFAPQG
jgi:hypothetical protein